MRSLESFRNKYACNSHSEARMKALGLALFAWVFLAALLGGCGGHPESTVVVYCAQDQVFAEPLLAEFTRQTGIKARPGMGAPDYRESGSPAEERITAVGRPLSQLAPAWQPDIRKA